MRLKLRVRGDEVWRGRGEFKTSDKTAGDILEKQFSKSETHQLNTKIMQPSGLKCESPAAQMLDMQVVVPYCPSPHRQSQPAPRAMADTELHGVAAGWIIRLALSSRDVRVYGKETTQCDVTGLSVVSSPSNRRKVMTSHR